LAEALRLAGTSGAFLLALSALGAGPAAALGSGLRARAALAPLLGLALAASLLVSAGALVSARTATWALLAPLTAASLLWAAIYLRRRSPKGEGGDLILPAGLAVIGIVIAILPGLLGGTVGPLSLTHFDVWAYAPASDWLGSQTISDPLPVLAERFDTQLGLGWALTDCGCRLGPTEVQASGATLLGTGPDQVNLAFLGVLYGLLPASIWFAARNLGVGRWPAAFGSAFGLSPAILLFVADSTLGTLSGLVVLPALVALAFGAPGCDLRRVVLSGVLLGGLIALYPEYLGAFAMLSALGLLCALATAAARRELSRDHLLGTAAPLAGTALTAAIVAPVALQRAISYFGQIGDLQIELPRYLSPENIGAWAFGVLHLYELRRFDDLGWLAMALALLIPLALAGLGVYGMLKAPSRAAFCVAGPIAVAGALAIWVYFHYGDRHCTYCLFKSLTFALPFAGLAIAFGAEAVGFRPPRRAPLALLAGVALLALVRSDAALTHAQDLSTARIAEDERGLVGAADGLAGAEPEILLEGMDATAVPSFSLPAAYQLTRDGGARISYDAGSAAAIALLRLLPASRYYDPGYRYVVTTYPGIHSGRRLISRHGLYALMRRSPIDVAVMRPGWALDPAEGAEAVPWLQGPVRLVVASPVAGPASLRLGFAGPQAATTAITVRGQGVRVEASDAQFPVCVPLRLRSGLTTLTLTPHFAAGHPTLWPALRGVGVAFTSVALLDEIRPESEPIPPPAKLLALSELGAARGDCRR
jgi:hypothetical protein